MSNFKVGDKVRRRREFGTANFEKLLQFTGKDKDSVFVITAIGNQGDLSVDNYRGTWDLTPLSKNNWELVERVAEVLPEVAEWSFSEAARLQAAAHTAIDEYNKYIESKPETVFLKIFK